MDELDKKIEDAKLVIKKAIEDYPKIAIACSFGKDSIVVTHLVRSINKTIPVFSIMTIFKPKDTYKYLVKMYKILNLEPFTVYMVADKIPEEFLSTGITVKLLPTEQFNKALEDNAKNSKDPIYVNNPDLCCSLLKVEPTKMALRDLDAWICGLRNTEGRTRIHDQKIEKKGNLIKVNPILEFTESDVLNYVKRFNLPLHPWYNKVLTDGRRYRSLGCEPCTCPIFEYQLEREGRWVKTSKCGGECGIHTQILK